MKKSNLKIKTVLLTGIIIGGALIAVDSQLIRFLGLIITIASSVAYGQVGGLERGKKHAHHESTKEKEAVETLP